MRREEVRLDVAVVIETNDAGDAAIDRYVGLTLEQGRELATSPNLTRAEVLYHLARAFVLTGYDAHNLDGWADTNPGDITMRVDYIDEGL